MYLVLTVEQRICEMNRKYRVRVGSGQREVQVSVRRFLIVRTTEVPGGWEGDDTIGACTRAAVGKSAATRSFNHRPGDGNRPKRGTHKLKTSELRRLRCKINTPILTNNARARALARTHVHDGKIYGGHGGSAFICIQRSTVDL